MVVGGEGGCWWGGWLLVGRVVVGGEGVFWWVPQAG